VPPGALPFAAGEDDEVEIVATDLGLARALWEGVPAARLLARARLERDAQDLVGTSDRSSGADLAGSTWDALMARLLATTPASYDQVKRAVARHTRAASDEGPLAASDAVISALVVSLVASGDADASPAEGAATPQVVDEGVRHAAASYDARLGSAATDPRAAPFEACLALAATGATSAYTLGLTRRALDGIAEELGLGSAVVASVSPLYPWGDHDVPLSQRHACMIERADLERVVLRAERDLAALVARVSFDGVPVMPLVTGAAHLLARRGALLLAMRHETPSSARRAPTAPPSSWLPADFSGTEAAPALASALERGATTLPRARALILRGGDAALDAIGAEMLEVSLHPFASAVFAEILAGVARDRDVVRLVSYFAIAPDPAAAARALSQCKAKELSGVLRGWLESMVPADGEQTSGDAVRRLRACLGALGRYPHLDGVVRPIAARIGDPSPPSRS
jgi:hypothetical protein